MMPLHAAPAPFAPKLRDKIASRLRPAGHGLMVLLLLVGLQLSGCWPGSHAFAQPAGAVQMQGAGFRAPFFVAEKENRRIYLLGTFHVGRAEWYPLRPQITEALKRSDRFLTETGTVDPARLMAAMTRHAMCSAPCLSASLLPRTRKALQKYLSTHDAPVGQLERMRPWWAGILLDGTRLQNTGFETRWGVEVMLSEIAAGKPHLALETPEGLAMLMSSMDPLTADEFLYDVLRDDETTTLQDTEFLASLWQSGDADTLYRAHLGKLAEGQLTSYANFFTEKLLHGRNRHFIQSMLAQASPGRTIFVAVGALHLGGPKGLIKLLQETGWQVTQK